MSNWSIRVYDWKNGEKTLVEWASGLSYELAKKLFNKFYDRGHAMIETRNDTYYENQDIINRGLIDSDGYACNQMMGE